MIKGDATCPECGAGFRRIELSSRQGTKGEYRCPACEEVLEVLDGSRLIAYRLTVQPNCDYTSAELLRTGKIRKLRGEPSGTRRYGHHHK
jgi:transposase-like protein